MQLPRRVVLSGLGVLLLAGVFLGLSLRELATGPARAADEAMAVDCDASTPGIDTACTYGPGASFHIAVDVTNPGSGYTAYQVKVLWDDANLEYIQGNINAENLWPDCFIRARSNNQPGNPSVLYGCSSDGSTSTY